MPNAKPALCRLARIVDLRHKKSHVPLQYRAALMISAPVPMRILDRAAVEARIATNIHYHSDFIRPEDVQKTAASVNIHAGHPDAIVELAGAYFIPGHLCLYDSEGVRVLESCVRRGKNLAERHRSGPEVVPPPKDCPTVKGPVLYLSFLPDHWGHFLTESISRLWPRLVHPEFGAMPGFYCEARPLPNINEFLGCFGLQFGRNLFTADRPIRFETCFVPRASFSNRAECYAVHRDLFAHVSNHYKAPAGPAVDQPVYLSRGKFAAPLVRTIRHEPDVEAFMASAGARIVWPETLSLAQLIAMLNGHRHFVGCWGSAFHALAFRSRYDDCTTNVLSHALGDAVPIANYMMVDTICGNAAHYADCMRFTPGVARTWPNLDVTIDVDRFLAFVRSAPHLRAALGQRGAG